QPSTGGKADPVFVVAQTNTVRIFVDVPETDATLVKDGTPAVVSVQALRGEEFHGAVKRSARALDGKGGRTLPTELDLHNPDGRLWPGMYVTSTILIDRANFLIPTAAVVTSGDKSYCVLAEGGKARRTPVRLGVRDGQMVEVLKKKTPGKDGTWVDITGDEE